MELPSEEGKNPSFFIFPSKLPLIHHSYYLLSSIAICLDLLTFSSSLVRLERRGRHGSLGFKIPDLQA